MDQKDAVASLHASIGIGQRKPRQSIIVKRRDIQTAQVLVLEKALSEIRKRLRETPAWANGYNSAATVIEFELAAVRAESFTPAESSTWVPTEIHPRSTRYPADYIEGFNRCRTEVIAHNPSRAAAPVSGPSDAAKLEASEEYLNADGESRTYKWLTGAAAGGAPEVVHAARTMMAYYCGAEFPAAPVSGQGAMEVLQELVGAVEFTPLGVRATVAVAAAKKVLDSRPRSEDSRAEVSGDQDEN